MPHTYKWFWKRYLIFYLPFIVLITYFLISAVMSGEYNINIMNLLRMCFVKEGILIYFFLAKISLTNYYLPVKVFFSEYGITAIGRGDYHIFYSDIQSWGFEDYNVSTGNPAIHIKLKNKYLVLGLADHIEPDELLTLMHQKVPVS